MSHEPVKERQINIMKAGGATRGPHCDGLGHVKGGRGFFEGSSGQL